MPRKNNHDDLKFDPEIQRTRKEKAEYLAMIRKSLQIVKEGFGAQSGSKRHLSRFLLFKNLPMTLIQDAYTGSWNNQKVYFTTINYHTSVRTPRIYNAGYDNYLAGIITLKNSYPHTIIQPEILRLKLEDLFNRADTDFTHARIFSFLFYVITKDKPMLKQLLKDKNLNRLNTFLDAEIEINGNQCYFRCSRKAISMAEAKKFVRLGKLLTEIF